MKIELSREALLNLISPLLAVSPKAGPIPVLNCALFIAHSDGSLTAEGTDSIARVSSRTQCNLIETGGFCIHVHRLYEVLRALSASVTVKMETTPDNQHVLIVADRCRYKLNILPSTDFPAPPVQIEEDGQITTMTLSEEALRAALDSCAYAMCKEAKRAQINGITFDLSAERSRLVATDGHRLALAELPVLASHPIKTLIPPETIQYMQSKIGTSTNEVTLTLSNRNIRIAYENITYQNSLKTDQTVDYERVLPKIATNLIAPRIELIGALERSKIIAHEKQSAVLLRIDRHQIGFFANNKEEGDNAHDSVAVDSKIDQLDISFNLNYILDALRSIDDETVHLSMRSSYDPIVISGTQEWSHINVLMPVRT